MALIRAIFFSLPLLSPLASFIRQELFHTFKYVSKINLFILKTSFSVALNSVNIKLLCNLLIEVHVSLKLNRFG